jgi:hypothetical protein
MGNKSNPDFKLMKYWTEEKIMSAKYKALIKEKRKIIADIYWALKKDFHQMELQDIYYDVGLMVGHCLCINKPNLSNKIYDQFMGSK